MESGFSPEERALIERQAKEMKRANDLAAERARRDEEAAAYAKARDKETAERTSKVNDQNLRVHALNSAAKLGNGNPVETLEAAEAYFAWLRTGNVLAGPDELA